MWNLILLCLLFSAASATAVTDSALVDSSDTQKLYTVKLKDGQTLTGQLLQNNDSLVILATSSGAEIRLPTSIIVSIAPEKEAYVDTKGQITYPDPNKTRYLFSPSAFMLKKGEMKLSQHEVVWTNFSVGITDYLSVQAGTAVPFWFAGSDGDGFNILLAVKGGGKIAPLFHLAGGIEMLMIPVNHFTVGLPFATATVGNDDYHVSVTGSVPFSIIDGSGNAGDLYWFTLCGFARLGTHIGLVNENWLFKFPGTGNSNSEYVTSLAARVFGRKFSSDIGLMFYRGFEMPLPWLSFTFHF